MIQTSRKPKLRMPPRNAGYDPSAVPAQDLAALATTLREVSITAHKASRLGADDATKARLMAQVDGVERGFRELGLDDLARFTVSLKRKIASTD
jgi:hypothetical protein